MLKISHYEKIKDSYLLLVKQYQELVDKNIMNLTY